MLLKRAKREYYEKEIEKNGNDTRKNWRLINRFLNNTDPPHLSKITVHDCSITDPSDTAEAFSNHFAKCDSSQITPSLPVLSRCPHSFYLRPTSAAEVYRVISSFKTSGPGLDYIHPSKIKLVSRELSPILAQIINKLFKAGKFPDCLKVGKITPVFAKCDYLCINN